MSYCSVKSITIPESVTDENLIYFEGSTHLETVTSIGEDAFGECESLTTIVGTKGSFAETFANENGYTFVEK